MTIYFRPCGSLSRSPLLRGGADEEIVERVSRATGIETTIDPSVDYEDWMEPVAMLDAAIAAGVEILVLPPDPLRLATCRPVARIEGSPCRDMLIGRMRNGDLYEMRYFDFGWPPIQDHLANHYAELEAFRDNAGRRCILADMPGEPVQRPAPFGTDHGGKALGDVMAEFAPGTILVKQVYPAKSMPLLSYDLDKTFRAEDGNEMFIDDVGFHFARFEGDRAALLVQNRIDMSHETRAFVVDGKIIAGAACIESDTPAQSMENWPTRWEVDRNSGEMDERPASERLQTSLTMKIFTEELVAAITEEAPDLKTFVADIALDGQGSPIVVELNPIGNSGLYAVPADTLFKAYLENAKTAPHRTPEPWDPEAVLATAAREPERTLLDDMADEWAEFYEKEEKKSDEPQSGPDFP